MTEELLREAAQLQEKLKQERAERGIPEREAMRPIREPDSAVPLPEAMERFLSRYTIVEEDCCPKCGGLGWETIPASGKIAQAVIRCSCQTRNVRERMAKFAAIPQRYSNCTFATFETFSDTHVSITNALFFAKKFVEQYPVDRRGILFHGGVGAGKTHLSVAMLHGLILKGIVGRFVHYPELLQMIRQSYNDDGVESEASLLYPVHSSEVLVIDELGAVKASEFAVEMLALIMNQRYNRDLTTITTTNYQPVELRDRLGERAFSRLTELCRFVSIQSEDFRKRK